MDQKQLDLTQLHAQRLQALIDHDYREYERLTLAIRQTEDEISREQEQINFLCRQLWPMARV